MMTVLAPKFLRLYASVVAAVFGILALAGCSATLAPTPPIIITQPNSQTIYMGQTATFSAAAVGTLPLAYQWYANGTAIGGATSSTYTTPAITTQGSSSIYVKVINVYGSATSQQATLTANPLVPVLTFAAIAGHTYGDPRFAVSATSASAGAVTYSVLSGPATISGNIVTLIGAGTVELQASQAASGNYAAASATTRFSVAAEVPTLSFAAIAQQIYGVPPFTVSATSASSGAVTYSVLNGPATISGNTVMLTGIGSVTLQANQTASGNYAAATATASFNVIHVPVITQQPVSTNACAGSSPTFTIAANYASSYAWYNSGGSPVGTGTTLTFPAVSSSNDGGYYSVVSNSYGSVTSNTAILNVLTGSAPSITSNPTSESVYVGQTATFAVSANGTGTLSYQWYKNGTAISGANSSTYTTGTLATADDGSTFYATVADGDCTGTTLTSATATLTVTNEDTAVPPTIVVQPAGQTAPVNGTATFTVVATGSGTLTYQWYVVPYSANQSLTPGTIIPGATGSSYTTNTTAQSDDGDEYYVMVMNAYGSAVSERAGLAVGSGISIQIVGQPQSEFIAANTLASFSVTAECNGCIPAYQWYWFAPGATKATALTNGAVSSGSLSGAIVSGATTSSVTLDHVPATASGSIFYVIITSTSDGSTPISGTNPLTSNTAGLFVGSLGTIGNPLPGEGLCNNSATGVNWVLNGNKPGNVPGDVPFQDLSACTLQLTNNLGSEHASVYWPTPISTAKFTVSFTVALISSGTPADGFAMILANPSQGATTATLGRTGEGLGAAEVPGFVLGFDTYQNCNDNAGPLTNTCKQNADNGAADPITVPYMAVGQGAASLWENPWTNVNGYLDTQNSSDYTAAEFANATHAYVVTVVNGAMTVTMDGQQLFTGTVSLPPVAYFGFTGSTGSFMESVTVSNLTATISSPH
jgi:hypothetical protein